MFLKKLLLLTGLASIAASLSTPAIKDATILLTADTCPQCPLSLCSHCLLGHNTTIQASSLTSPSAQALIGFRLPIPPDQVSSCSLQFPAFVKLYDFPVTLTFSLARNDRWDEDNVDGTNAPACGDVIFTVDVPPLTNPPPVDLTEACVRANRNGAFSVYMATQGGEVEIWSKDSGNPAILHLEQLAQT